MTHIQDPDDLDEVMSIARDMRRRNDNDGLIGLAQVNPDFGRAWARILIDRGDLVRLETSSRDIKWVNDLFDVPHKNFRVTIFGKDRQVMLKPVPGLSLIWGRTERLELSGDALIKALELVVFDEADKDTEVTIRKLVGFIRARVHARVLQTYTDKLTVLMADFSSRILRAVDSEEPKDLVLYLMRTSRLAHAALELSKFQPLRCMSDLYWGMRCEVEGEGSLFDRWVRERMLQYLLGEV